MVLSLELTEAVIPAHLHVEVWDSSVVWLEIASRAFIVKCFRSMPDNLAHSERIPRGTSAQTQAVLVCFIKLIYFASDVLVGLNQTCRAHSQHQ
ncbi:uncharacterized protein [Physcomitrium patens]|uniref:uncharacterized protein isoform X2 n=1 Tax=Physcomitrium patens TaxID=3218 RepID=UPI003CCCF0D0